MNSKSNLSYVDLREHYVYVAGEVHIFRQDWNFNVQCYAVSEMFSCWHQIRVS